MKKPTLVFLYYLAPASNTVSNQTLMTTKMHNN